MFNLFLRSACVRSSHCFVWFELSSQAGLAVPEPQKNVRGELVLLQNSSHLHRLVQKKSTPGDQASLETGLDENDASIANIVRLLKFIPGRTFYEIGCKSWSAASKVNTLFRSPSFWLTHKRAGTTEFVAINMNINWNVQKEKYIKVINISKILRNMDNRPFHAVWRVHCQDGQLSQDFFPQSLWEQVCDSKEKHEMNTENIQPFYLIAF